MKRTIALVLVALLVNTSCVSLNPRQSFNERQEQRVAEYHAQAKDDAVIALWNFKEKLKKDYSEIVGPSEAYNERMDILYGITHMERLLTVPGVYERVAKRWDATKEGQAMPSREELEKSIKVLEGRVKTLDAHLVKELAAAEEQAKQDAEKLQIIIKTVAVIALVAMAVAVGVTATHSGPYTYGPYTVQQQEQSGTVQIWTPRRPYPYTCQRTGNVISNCW